MVRFIVAVLVSVFFAQSVDAKSVLIFGATRNTGLELAKRLVERGDDVTAFVRTTSDVTALNELGVEQVVGDALDVSSVVAAFDGREYDAVVTTLSGSVRNTSVDSQGNINVFAAAETAGVGRIVFVTAIGTSGTENVLAPGARQFLEPVLRAKTEAESDLRARDLQWTILRPGQLPDGPSTGRGLLSEDQTLMGRITRGELAALIVKCLDDDSTVGKIYHVVDADQIGNFSSFD